MKKSKTSTTARTNSRIVHAVQSWRNLDAQMPRVNRAFNQVRNELADIGLLADGIYLDEIELVIAALPSFGEAGYVFDNETGWLPGLFGFKPGVIYLPSDLPSEAYVPGGTLTDTIRHEFAHAWYWLDSAFFEQPWFRQTFGYGYSETSTDPSALLLHQLGKDKAFAERVKARSGPLNIARCVRDYQKWAFVSEYATTSAKEDFAETFMFYLRYRNSLDRFRPRGGLYKKLKNVERAVSQARRVILASPGRNKFRRR